MNRIFANPAAVPAIPEKPKNAASNATTRNTTAQYNIGVSSISDEIRLIGWSSSAQGDKRNHQ